MDIEYSSDSLPITQDNVLTAYLSSLCTKNYDFTLDSNAERYLHKIVDYLTAEVFASIDHFYTTHNFNSETTPIIPEMIQESVIRDKDLLKIFSGACVKQMGANGKLQKIFEYKGIDARIAKLNDKI